MNKDKLGTLIQFIKFGLVGCSNTLLSYVVFYLSVKCGLHYQIANVIGFVIGVLNAYFWSNRYVFKTNASEKRNHITTLAKTFAAYGVTGIVLQSILLYLLVEKAGIYSTIAQAMCLFITVPLNFILNKFWSFKNKKNEENNSNDSLLQ